MRQLTIYLIIVQPLRVCCECHQSVGPVSAGALKADRGWFLCVLHPLSLHPSTLHPSHSANPGENKNRENGKGAENLTTLRT